MLEKVGLPAKPSMRGGNWVDDASHCQGCSSQFTFFNRKHHCRRCGGLFCNTCTQQRMILRGQGDSPVRICDPCKKLEEAARFELRYGNRNRASKGGSKQALKHEDDILNEILGNDGGKPFSSARQSSPDIVSDLQRAVSSASCSNLDGEAFTPDKKVDTPISTSSDMQNCGINELGSSSPEELHQQALEEKKKYKILKGEGKSDEALRAFKRGKELERQAAALELALRKSRRKTSTLNNVAATKETNDDAHQSDRKDKLLSQMGKDVKHDLAAELRELGWSDADLHDSDKKPAPISLEGELSTLLRETHKASAVVGGAASIDRTEVIALKKKALTFKREGKLAEAKEELKKAKVLEKQLEEQELLGDADDSADELSALILSMDDDGKQDDLKLDYMKDPGFDMGHLTSLPDDFASDGNFDVTDDDMNDPEIAKALRSFGWAEDANDLNESVAEPAPVDAEALHNEVMSLKKEALNLKRAGNIKQAMEQLKKAKLLERDLENSPSASQSGDTPINYLVPNSLQKDLPSLTDAMHDDNVRINKGFDKSPPKSKLAIQKELLGLKKKALALRREGRLDEAEEELKKGKILERQLEEMENAPKAVVTKGSHEKRKDLELVHEPFDLMEEEADVTEQDMHDPALLSVLKNFGWEDEEIETMSKRRRSSKEKDGHSEHGTNMRNKPEIPERKLKSKAEIQRELLGIKRKALALKRQGKHEEAEEELRMAKVLEAEMAEMESISQKELNNNSESFISQDNYESEGTQTKGKVDLGWKENEPVQPTFPSYSISVGEASQHNEELDQAFTKHVDVLPEANESAYVDLLSGNDERTTHSLVKKPANDATAILPLPNTFSRSETSINLKPGVAQDEVSSSSILNHIDEKREKSVPFVERTPNHEPNAASGSNYQSSHMSCQQEILAMKKRAVALKREGKLAEAREELRQAKLLEKGLQEEAHNDDISNVNVSASISNDASVTPESSANQTLKPVSSRDRFKLQQESLAHKRQALKLRREGRIEESEAEFELAKALESQLEEMGAHDSHPNRLKNKVEATDDASVEDLLDPELLSALKGIGLQDVGIVEQAPRKSETHPSVIKSVDISPEKGQLEERIKAEKVRALNLKRAGKQTEALDALRRAKQLEKKLNSLAS